SHRVLTYTLITRCFLVFFFTNPPTTQIYTLSLHDALPISADPRTRDDDLALHEHLGGGVLPAGRGGRDARVAVAGGRHRPEVFRSEEHTSELQSRFDLVCRLLLEKKNRKRDKRQVVEKGFV